ncbi:A/G-specific adenine glycosylase [Candidatus Azambacteria bacterium]|nr:A/G-specific adenine glycosylase [Candidatus Azambacteria bacterium]
MVSEVMLQQTQVSRVLEKYPQFLKKFPNGGSLARARLADVIRVWSGLGYNRRAIFLYRAAKEIVEKFDGVFPRDVSTLQKLPGLGPTTAAAIAAFSFDADAPVIDTNVRRVLTAFFSEILCRLETLAQKLVPKGKNRDWTYALFDFGAMALRRNGGLTCPLHADCRWLEKMRELVARGARRVKRGRSGKGVRFEETNRYFRGRIVEMARTGSVPITKLKRTLRLSKDRFEKIIQSLKKDSLVNIAKGRVSLP